LDFTDKNDIFKDVYDSDDLLNVQFVELGKKVYLVFIGTGLSVLVNDTENRKELLFLVMIIILMLGIVLRQVICTG